MSKAGKKLIAAAQEAVRIAQSDFTAIKECKVTPSTGCVFCDIGLDPIKMKRQWIHYNRRQGIAICTAKGTKPNVRPV